VNTNTELERGRWNRETWQRGTRLNRSQRVEHPSAQEKKSKMLNDKRINPVCHDSTAALTVACSFCIQSAILSALIRSPYTRGSTTAAAARAARTNTRTGRQAPVPAATTSGASESATAATATTSDDCCEVCIAAPRAGFAQVPCGHTPCLKKTGHAYYVSYLPQNRTVSMIFNTSNCPSTLDTLP